MLQECCIKHVLSSGYRPQSQCALESHHQILKYMEHTFYYDTGKCLDLAVSSVVYVTREFVFPHCVHSPLDVLRAVWSSTGMCKAELLLIFIIRTR